MTVVISSGVITAAPITAGFVDLAGTLNSVASKTYRLEFFSGIGCHPAGNGEGRHYLGSLDVITDGGGNAPIGARVVAVDLSLVQIACLELKAEFVDMDGQPYECNLYDWFTKPAEPPLIGQLDLDAADMYVNWRTYVEPATDVGPDDNELLYDRAIYFGPYFTEP